MSELPGRASQLCGPSDQSPSIPGHLVEPTGPRTPARVAQDSWSTSQGLGYWPESPGRSGRNCEPLEPGASRPGQLVDPAGHRALALVAQDHGSTPLALEPSVIRPGELVEAAGPLTHARVAWENSLIPRTIRPGPERNGRAGRPRGLSDTHPRPSELLVNPARPQVQSPVAQERWSTPRAHGHGPVSPQTPVRQRGTSYQGRSRPGQLVDHGHSDPDRSHLGQLVDPAAPRNGMRVSRDTWLTPWDLGTGPKSRDRWSTPWALGARPESPETAGEPRSTSSTAPRRPGQLVDRGP